MDLEPLLERNRLALIKGDSKLTPRETRGCDAPMGSAKMSGPESADDPITGPAPRRALTFRKYSKKPLPTPDEARRQSHVVQSAWRHFGEAGPVIAFLDTRRDGLEGQPLHLAIESDECLVRVEALLSRTALEAQPETRICE